MIRNVYTLRGVGDDLDVVIVDEAAYVPIELITNVIVPLLQLIGVVLIMISTRKSDVFDFFNEIQTKKYPDGSDVFAVYSWVAICDECKADDKKRKSCKHRERERPYWVNKDSSFIAEFLSSHGEAMAREIQGDVGTPTRKNLFSKKAVDMLFSKKRILPANHEISENFIFISVDPNGGGDGSNYSAVAMVFEVGRSIIVGAENCHFEDVTADVARIKMWGNSLRRLLKGMNTATLVWAPESNLGREAGWFNDFLRGQQELEDGSILPPLENYVVLNADRGFVGIRTNNNNKREMAMLAHNHIENHMVWVHENAVTFHAEGWGSIVSLMEKQLRVFLQIVDLPKKEGGKETVRYSGKAAGPDDLAMCLLLNFLAHNEFIVHREKFLDPLNPFNHTRPTDVPMEDRPSAVTRFFARK